ncbi:MAG: aminoacyl-tRNA hydrolase [Melioribacteraceae bacterium]|nr:aminoacyl-tRNA hydrolase [Melioribacteraceae bacterium]
MRAVFGIGNPGAKYVLTRHNAGFIIIDTIIEKLGLSFIPSKGDYYYAEGKLKDSEFIIIKPTTYVNNSGLAARDVLDFFDIAVEDLLVIVDDIALHTGNVRVRKSGGSGGHNGLESLIYHINSENFPRIRFGIGNRFEEGFQADYVLSKFSEKEFKELLPNFKFLHRTH